MASKTQEARVKFTAETGEFNKQIKNANSTLSQLRSELKLNATQMKSTGESVDMLASRQKILAQEAEASQAKIAALEAKLNTAKSIFGANSTEVQKLTTQLNNARIAEERIQQDIQQCNTAMEQQAQASREAESAMGRLESNIESQERALAGLKGEYANVALEQGQNSTEAQQLARRIQDLSQELNSNKSAMNEARQAADRLGRELDEVGDEAQEAARDFDAMDAAAGVLGGIGIGSAVSSLFEFSQASQEVVQDLGQLDTAFTSQNSTVEAARDVYSDFYGLLGESDTATEASNNLVRLTNNTDEMKEMTIAAAGAFAQMGDALPIENLIEGAQETAKTATLTGGLTDAVNWSTKSNQEWAASLAGNHKAQAAFNKALADGETREDAYNAALAACTTEQERAELIMSSLTMAYGEAGKQYLENNKTLIEAREAQGNFNAVMAEAGEKVMPFTTALQNIASGGLSWLLNNLPIVTPLITGFGVALGGLTIVAAIRSGFFGLSAILAPITGAFSALSAPVLIVVGVLAALAAIFVGLWNNSEAFRTAVTNLGNTISGFFGPIIQQIGDYLGQVLPIALQYVTDFIAAYVIPGITAFTTFLQETVFPALQQFGQWFSENILPALQKMWEWFSINILPILAQFAEFILSTVIPVIGQIAAWIISNAVPALQQFWSWFQANILPILQDFWNFVQTNVLPVLADIGNWIMTDVVPALSNMWNWFSANILPVLSQVWSFIQANILPILGQLASFILGNVINALKNMWNVFSTIILPILKQVWDAVKTGIDRFTQFADGVKNAINTAKDTVSNGINAIKGFFSGLRLELPKIKLPHFSISGTLSLNPPQIPHISVQWYAEGGILNAPTIFGAAGGKLLGGGEAGPEAVLPIDKLEGYIENVMERNENNSGFYRLAEAVEGLAERVISIEINGKQLMTAVASDADRVNGSRQNLANRRLSLR